MEDYRTAQRLNRAELTEDSTPTAPKQPRFADVRGESLELRSEEREAEPPLLLLPCSDSSEKIRTPSEAGEIVSSNLASSSSSGASEPPRSSARNDQESVNFVKRPAKSLETEASAFNSDFSCSRETTLPSQAATKSATMKPSPASERRRPPKAETPSPGEMESFFSAAEKGDQQRFAEKYNYDVVKDVPLEGRYDWIRLRP